MACAVMDVDRSTGWQWAPHGRRRAKPRVNEGLQPPAEASDQSGPALPAPPCRLITALAPPDRRRGQSHLALCSGCEVQYADRLACPPVWGGGGDDRSVGTVRGGLGRVLAVRRGPGLLPRDGQGRGQVEVEDGDAGQGGQMLGCAGPGAVGFDQRARRGIEEPARFGVGAVDQARSEDIALAGRSHRGLVQDDVHGVAHRPVT